MHTQELWDEVEEEMRQRNQMRTEELRNPSTTPAQNLIEATADNMVEAQRENENNISLHQNQSSGLHAEEESNNLDDFFIGAITTSEIEFFEVADPNKESLLLTPGTNLLPFKEFPNLPSHLPFHNHIIKEPHPEPSKPIGPNVVFNLECAEASGLMETMVLSSPRGGRNGKEQKEEENEPANSKRKE